MGHQLMTSIDLHLWRILKTLQSLQNKEGNEQDTTNIFILLCVCGIRY